MHHTRKILNKKRLYEEPTSRSNKMKSCMADRWK
jgi:hypothetical protein